jgi:hypothetical protein
MEHTRPPLSNRPEFTAWAGEKIIETWTRLGYARETRDDGLQQVRYLKDGIEYIESHDVALFHVDPYALPYKVKAADLVKPEVLHEISTVLGGVKVSFANRSGVVIMLDFSPPEPEPEPELPRKVPLDLGGIPQGQYMIPMGEGRRGPRWVSLLDTLNILIGGEPGAGKSMQISTWLVALTATHTPEALQLTLIDPKTVELSNWRHLPHLISSIATQATEAEAVVDELLDEIDRRARLMTRVGARNLQNYHLMTHSEEPIPLHLVVIDEITDLAIDAGGSNSSLFKKLIRAASKGRALGIIFVLATQSPRAQIINANLKAVCNTRIGFRVASATDSRVILDLPDAARIPKGVPGRMVALLKGGLSTLQGYYISDEDLLKFQQSFMTEGPTSVEDVLTPQERWVANIACFDLGGQFKIDEIYAITGPKSEGGVSRRWLVETARRWERLGWLASNPSDPTQARVVTDAFKAILACD